MIEKDSELAFKVAEKKWTPIQGPQEEIVQSLLEIKGLQPVMAKLLAQRGIKSEEDLKHFFNPNLDDLHDPFLMKDMQKAVDRLKAAMEREEKMMVFGDYDVDGTTATSLFFMFLNRHYPHLQCYIPDRYQEGYGISNKAIELAAELGISLIVALDCGIKSIDKIQYAKDLGIDFIICDHHLPGAEVPRAVAVLDPKQVDCNYPYKELSGCGVGFKLLQALASTMEWDSQPLLEHLDLLAVSIAADIVPITGENRILTHFGLQQINQNPSHGLRALMEVSGFKPKHDDTFDLKVDRLVFGIGPRINAAGRIGHGMGAVDLLVSQGYDEAKSLVGQIDDQNLERKELDKQTTHEALQMLQEDWEDNFTTVLFQSHWHKGVIGIVASRCIEVCHRPTIILTESNGVLTGSGRSIRGLDLYDALDACKHHLLQFGGHFFAAGLSLLPEKLDDFKTDFEKAVRDRIEKEDLLPEIFYDAEISLDEVNAVLLRQINRMGPFGPQNLSPLFCAKRLTDNGNSRLLESKSGGTSHIKFEFQLPANHSLYGEKGILDGIGFGLGNQWELLKSKMPFDILFHIEENEFRGVKKVQLAVKAIRESLEI